MLKFFSRFRSHTQSVEERTKAILQSLKDKFARESDVTLETLSRLSVLPDQAQELSTAFVHLANARAEVMHFKADDPTAAIQLLSTLHKNLITALHAHPGSSFYAQQTLAHTLAVVTDVLPELQPLTHAPKPPVPQTGPKTIVVPTNLLYLSHRTLFPPERMIVVAGEPGPVTRLAATFDVTGEANAGHVRAHPPRLTQALLAFAKSKSFLAAWGHSHPGTGPESTHPSPIDIEQHAAWIKNYTPNLLSFIVVADGFIRFFGTALQEGRIRLEIIGGGIRKEHTHEHVYRIEV